MHIPPFFLISSYVSLRNPLGNSTWPPQLKIGSIINPPNPLFLDLISFMHFSTSFTYSFPESGPLYFPRKLFGTGIT